MGFKAIRNAVALLSFTVAGTGFAYHHERDLVASCVEDDPHRTYRNLEVDVADEGGRLIASIYQGGRLISNLGVAQRHLSGREFDTIFIGRGARVGNIRLFVDSLDGGGLLELNLHRRTMRVPVFCQLYQ